MRIAWLCPYLPAPENSGGRIRISNLARALADHELHLYLRVAEDDPPLASITPEHYPPWRTIHAAPPRWPRKAPPLTPKVSVSFPPELKQLLAEHDREQPFDAVVLEHCYSAHELPRLQHAAVLLSEHNVESDYSLYAARTHPRLAVRNLIEHVRWRRFERASWREADVVTVVTERDRERVTRVRGPGVAVIPNGIALDRYRYVPPSRRTGNTILFVGMMSYDPNIAAAKRLAKRVLPLVRRRVPDATLTIAGRDPERSVLALAGPAVRVTGTVPDVAAVFDEHAVFANPITFGGGSSLKVVEALATGTPLCASSFAVRGMPIEAGRDYLLGEDPAALAEAIIHALTQRETLDEMAARGRRIAEELAWSELGARFAEVVRSAVEAKRRGGPGRGQAA